MSEGLDRLEICSDLPRNGQGDEIAEKQYEAEGAGPTGP